MAKKTTPEQEKAERYRSARNWHALNGLTRKVWKRGNGKKQASRDACRGRIRPE